MLDNNRKLKIWISKNKPLKPLSKLQNYMEEINILISDNYTQTQICEYLKEVHNVETTRSNLGKYIKKNISAKTVNEEKSKNKKDSTTAEAKNTHYLKMLENFGNGN
jgi:hypothetical protein